MLVFALVALPPTLLGIFDAIEASRVQSERLRDSVRNYAAMASSYQHALIQNSASLLSDMAQSSDILPAAGVPDRDICTQALARAIRPFPVYVSLNVFAADGTVICGSGPEYLPQNPGKQDYVRQTIASKSRYLSGYVKGSEPGIPILVLAQPALTEADGVRAVLALSIRLDRLEARDRFLSLPKDGVLYVLDRNGLALLGVTLPPSLGSGGLPPASAISDLRSGRIRSYESRGQDGMTRVYAASILEAGSLLVLVGVPKAGGLLGHDYDLITQIPLVLAIWLSGMFAAWLGTQLLVTRWTKRLFETTSAYSKGNLTARADLSGAPAEIRQLGDTLAEMAASLNARQMELRFALDQKDLMLREIHHRIKNNLQTVTSLLNLYSRSAETDLAKQALQDVRIRVQALALVHKHLYESPEHQSVNLKPLLEDLGQLVKPSVGAVARRVALSLNVAPMDVNMERAVPLALLATELISDAFRRGFPDGCAGTVSVELQVTEGARARLTVAHDGVAEPQGLARGPHATDEQLILEESLIRGFAAQLGAEIEMSGSPPSSTTVSFPATSAAMAQAADPNPVRQPPGP
jgi:two-component sensor histidine kinase